jgi:hexosaminidase
MRILSILLLATPLAAQAPTHTLLPVPASVEWTGDRLRLDSAFTVAITGHRDGRLERAVDRAARRLEARTAIPLPRSFPGTGTARLAVVVTGPGYSVPDLREDESYRLEVSADRAVLTASTVVGAIRGLETLLQLQATDSAGYYLEAATIDDAPRFPWRGLLVDAARHWQPPEVIKRTLDGMAAVKLNVLHWHLTEDQGFRVESRRYPALHRKGSDGLYYTQDEIREIVAYAADRGIRVVPEFDMPGHTTSWLVGHPEIATMPGPYAIERRWGVHRPTMDPTSPATWALLEGFIAEMVELFPDRHWHVGGDEVDPNHWNTAAHVQAWMRERDLADAHAVQTHFNERLFAILARHDRQPVGWDEILQPGLPQGAVIQSWRGSQGLIEATRQGRQAILSAPYYLDHIKTAAEMYLEDPLPTGLAPEQQLLVLGGEACMWGEYITMETIDSRIWPRMAAIAERFWSPAAVRDVADLYRRLPVVSRRLTEVGLTHYTHRERMLARMAGDDDAAVLREFLRYARPRGFAGRGTNQLSPLTRLIDAAEPDPFTEWEMLELAQLPVGFPALEQHFLRMRQFEAELTAMLPRAPMAADGLPLATALAELGRVGMDLLTADRTGRRPDAAWFANADSVIARTEGKTFGLLRPVGVAAVKRLVEGFRPR